LIRATNIKDERPKLKYKQFTIIKDDLFHMKYERAKRFIMKLNQKYQISPGWLRQFNDIINDPFTKKLNHE